MTILLQKRMKEAHNDDERAHTMDMLLTVRRACNHPWLAKAFWDAQGEANSKEAYESLPHFNSEKSAKIAEVLKLVKQHPRKVSCTLHPFPPPTPHPPYCLLTLFHLHCRGSKEVLAC